MSLRFLDGFDHYAIADILTKWTAGSNTGNATLSNGNSRFGVGQGFVTTNYNFSLTRAIDAQTTWVIGFAYKLNNNTQGDVRLFQWIETGTSTVQASLGITTGGNLKAWRGDLVTALGTAASALSTGIWYFIEWKLTINNTTGVFQVKVNGIDYLNLTSQNTRGGTVSTADQLRFQGSGGNTNAYLCTIDDLYVCDSAGSVNNDFLGDCRVQTLGTTSAGNYAQFTPSASTNVSCVDETLANGDTDYVSDSTVGHIDSYVLADLLSGTQAPKGVQTNHWSRKDDAGARQLAPLWRIASTDYVGATATLGSSYVDSLQVYETSPATSAAWTVSEINGAELGMKVIS